MTAESAAAPLATVPPSRPTTRATRLTRRQDFLMVLQQGQRVRHPLLGVGFRPNGLDESRVGYAVGKRVGNAVTRNRIRRRLRAIMRATSLAGGYDIVVTARPEAAAAPFDALARAFLQCARRGKLLDGPRGAGR